jgi:N-alpha-acetyltransferase 15/16, NatA auxiliary subunit
LINFLPAKVATDAYPGDIKGDSLEKTVSDLEAFAKEFPRALVPQRILLTITTGEKFDALIKKYLHRGLKKNIPSLFVDIKPLYKDDAKRERIQYIVEDYRVELEAKKASNADGERVPLSSLHIF